MAEDALALPPVLRLYRAILARAEGPLRAYLRRRMERGKEDAERLPERFGHASLARPEGALLWAHGASVGESLAILPLLERLTAERPGLSALVTTGTVTSARLLARRLREPVHHQFVPVDHPGAVARFLDHWRPDLALWVESEFWPNLVTQTAARQIPMVLVNARLSERSARGWRRARASIERLVQSFDLALAVDAPTAGRLESLGAEKAIPAGNLKWANPPLPADEGELAALRAALGDRPVWLAASTHAGEEEMVGAAHEELLARYPGLVTIIVPRHPERGAEIERTLHAGGLKAGLRTAGAAFGAAPFYIADTIGEMGLFYRLAPVVFMGGSLVPHGGQNPLEPARLGSAILFGPHTDNFAELCAALLARGGARRVADGAGLAAAVGALLGDDQTRGDLAGAAGAFAEEGAAVMERVVEHLRPFLDRIAPAGGVGDKP